MKVEIPDAVYKELEKIAKDVGFNSVDELVGSILEEFVAQYGEEENQLPPEEEEKIKARLRALGYID